MVPEQARCLSFHATLDMISTKCFWLRRCKIRLVNPMGVWLLTQSSFVWVMWYRKFISQRMFSVAKSRQPNEDSPWPFSYREDISSHPLGFILMELNVSEVHLGQELPYCRELSINLVRLSPFRQVIVRKHAWGYRSGTWDEWQWKMHAGRVSHLHV